MLTDYLLCRLEEIMRKITETLFQTIMYQTLKYTTVYFNCISNNDYTTGNLLDFGYFKENYKLIDLSKQTKLKDSQQSLMKLMEKLCSLSLKNQKKQFLIFHKILSKSYNGNTKNCKFIKCF